MREAFIFDGLRTPFGRYGGGLAAIRPDDLLAMVLKALLERNPFAADAVEDVIVGCTNQAGEDARNVARHALLRAGVPTSVAGITVNRLCGSGVAAAMDAVRAVKAGEGDLFIAGGVENMSRAPIVLAKGETAYSRQVRVFDSTMGARFPNPAIEAEYGADTMPETAENIARDLQISREETDRFALASQQKYERARAEGFFVSEILPLTKSNGRGREPATVKADEHPRPQTTYDVLSSLKPLHDGGIVTAGNASGVNDGAAVLLIGSVSAGERAGSAPRARILGAGVAGVEPRVMGLGPVPAMKKALDRAGLTLADMDVIEINEAFAAQVIGCTRQLGISADDPRLNPNGGAIAMGHPLGASGARLILTTVRQLEEMGARYGIVSMCIGIGQGIALVIERLEKGRIPGQ